VQASHVGGIVCIICLIALVATDRIAFAQAGSTGGTIGKTDKSVSGGDASSPARRTAAPSSGSTCKLSSVWSNEIVGFGTSVWTMMVVRDRDRVRLVSRGGRDWADRFPLVVSGALKLPEERVVIDGEVVILNEDGTSDFDKLASRKHDGHAQIYAFDLISGDGKDLRTLPLSMRKVALAELLSDQVDGVFLAEYEKGDIGDVLFRVACNMGLEGIVSKRLDRAYGAGRCKHWIKIKNPAHPAYSRVRDQLTIQS
jgi:bifunctional non-homologous end joining protein LigD